MATTDEALARALRELPGWQRHGDGIWKTCQFDDFASATLFVGRAGPWSPSGHLAGIRQRPVGPAGP
jgi:pterin-4a-carbinolamine dehydratase